MWHVVCECDFYFGKACKHICLNADANVNADADLADGSIHGLISVNRVAKNFDVSSQLGSKRDIPHSHLHLHTAYLESYLNILFILVMNYKAVSGYLTLCSQVVGHHLYTGQCSLICCFQCDNYIGTA